MKLKNAPHPNGGLPCEPFDGDVYLVRYCATGGNLVSRLFFSPRLARGYYDQVVAEGGLPTLHRTAASWGECT